MKKRCHSIAVIQLAALLIAALCLGVTPAFAQMPQHHYAIVTTTDPTVPIPLYERPERSASVFYAYYHGALVKVLDQEQADWWKVSVAGVQGFMEAAYLKVVDFAEMDTVLPVMNIKNRTDSGVLNLRERPSLESPIIRQYYNGEYVLVMGVSDGWYHVIGYGGRVGYMKPEFLEAAGITGQYMFTEDLLQLRPRSK